VTVFVVFTVTVGEPPRNALISIFNEQSGSGPALAWGAVAPAAKKTPMIQMNMRCNGIAALLFEIPEFETSSLRIEGAPIVAHCPIFVDIFWGFCANTRNWAS
jgi:hypothetical protein